MDRSSDDECMRRIRAISEASSQKLLLESILNSVSEGVSVADSKGNLIVVNRAMAALLGAATEEEVPHSIAEYYRLLSPRHEDGRPVSLDELPMMRAMRG